MGSVIVVVIVIVDVIVVVIVWCGGDGNARDRDVLVRTDETERAREGGVRSGACVQVRY